MYVFEALYTDFIIYSPFSQIHKIIITSHHDCLLFIMTVIMTVLFFFAFY